MRNSTLLWIAVIVIVAIGGILLLQNRAPQTQQPGIGGGPGLVTPQNRMEVNLDPVNRNQIDQSGKVTLEEKNGTVTVALTVNQLEGSNNQPAHIHLGSCPGVGDILFSLNNVVDGSSVTELNTSLDQLKSQRPLAINVHKSPQEISVYTSCGNLP